MMTREEAIKHLLHDWHINLGCDFVIKPGRLDDFLAALDVALSALRPVSREQVKKSEWIWRTEDVYICSSCGEKTRVDECMGSPIYNFCPFCMAPMTDEAVQMVMRRLEALKDE